MFDHENVGAIEVVRRRELCTITNLIFCHQTHQQTVLSAIVAACLILCIVAQVDDNWILPLSIRHGTFVKSLPSG